MRGKKLQSLVDKISFQTDLGPYSGGSYTSASGMSVNLELVTLSQLQSGVNTERVVVGRVVCSVCLESAVALSVILPLMSTLGTVNVSDGLAERYKYTVSHKNVQLCFVYCFWPLCHSGSIFILFAPVELERGRNTLHRS